jgi:hypothetical protein
MGQVAEVAELPADVVTKSAPDGVESGLEALETDRSALPDDDVLPPLTEKEKDKATKKAVKRVPEADRYHMPVPAPPRSANRQGTIEDARFFQYWHGLNKAIAGRIIVYLQRQWPVLNYALQMTPAQRDQFDAEYPPETRKPKDIDAFLRKIGIFKYVDKFTEPFDTKDWRTWILRHYGSGDYLLFLNDLGVPNNPGIPKQTVCKTITSLRDDAYPPVIDPNILDVFDPANASFIHERRLRGLPVPDDGQEKERAQEAKREDEEEMSAVITQVLEQNRDLTEKVVQASERRTAPAPTVGGIEPAAKMAEVFGDGAKRIVDLVSDAAARTAKAQDPQQYHENVMKAAQAFAPKGDGDGSATLKLLLDMQQKNNDAVLAILKESHEREMKLLTSRLDSLEKQHAQPATTAVSLPGSAPPSGIAGVIRELAEAQKELRKLTKGLGDDDEDSAAPGWAGVVERIAEKVFDAAPQFMENLQKFRETQVATANGNGQVAAAEVARPKAEDPNVLREKQIAESLRPFLTQAFEQHYRGYEFAGNIIAQYGLPMYQQFIGEGEAGLTSFLMRTGLHGPLVGRFGAPAVGQFITEFLDFPRASAVAQAMAQQNGQAAPPPATPANGAPAPGGPRVNRPPAN